MKELYLFLFVLSFIACQNPHRSQTTFKIAAPTPAAVAASPAPATAVTLAETSERPFAPISSIEELKEVFDLQSELSNPENPGIYYRPAIRLSATPNLDEAAHFICIARASGILDNDERQPTSPLDSPVLALIEEKNLPLQSSL